VGVQWERNVDKRNEDGQDIANDDDAVVVLLWDAHRWSRHSLCPAQAHVDSKDDHREDIEKAPIPILEDLELQLVNVTNRHWRHSGVRGPEQLKLKDSTEIDEVRWWADHVRLTVTKAELEQVDGHICQQHDTGDGKVELA